jgi:hypothetical protein
MCPDHEILSAFCDGEVTFPWNEQIKKHLASCNKCSRKLDAYRKLRTCLLEDSEPDCSPSMERVRDKINSLKQHSKQRTFPFWKKKVSVPVPFVAAAAVLVVFFGFLLVFTVVRMDSSTVNIVTERDDGSMTRVKIITKNTDEIEMLLKALENNTSSNEVIIKLPEGSNDFQMGEPKLIRAVNHNRKGQ